MTPIIAGAMLAAGALAYPGAGLTAIVWTVVSLLILALRAWHGHRFGKTAQASTDAHVRRSFNEYFGLVFLTCLLWAVYTVQFVGPMTATEKTLVMLLMSCLASSSAHAMSASRTVAMMFIACYLLPLTISFMLEGGPFTALGYFGAALFVTFTWLVFKQKQRATAQIGTQKENRKLMQTAVRQQRRLRRLNKELELAKESLLQMNHQLEERVRQRTLLLQREISEREGAQQQLQALATRDPLTRLANRAKLEEVMRAELARADETGSCVALFFIDLDRFKEINDNMGHDVGDRVLEIVARRLNNHAHKAACVARWGGDEFIILQPVGYASSDRLESFASSLAAKVRAPIQLGANTLGVGASVGIALYPIHGKDPEALIRHADLAVYQAKVDGRGRARMFQPIWRQQAKDRLDMVQALKTAIADDDLALVYQPIVDPISGDVVAMEALLRWQHPDMGEVAPDIFVRLAEENGLMVSLGNWVLRQAGRDARHLIGPRCPRVTINVSIHQFTHGDFIGMLDTVLVENSLRPGQIELELTETVYAREEVRIHETLVAVRERGVRIAIGDFGTGYSSLSYLQRFPVDMLKVDRTFVDSLDDGGDTIIGAVISIANSLNVGVVIEGIESPLQLRRVQALGAKLVQGFLFSHPMPLPEARAWLDDRTRPRVPEAQAALNGP